VFFAQKIDLTNVTSEVSESHPQLTRASVITQLTVIDGYGRAPHGDPSIIVVWLRRQ
jgi:hypothetical protein